MNRETAFILRVLTDYLSKRKTEPNYEVDWTILSKIAQFHQVSGIVYNQCKHFIPADFIQDYIKQYHISLYCYMNYSFAIKQIKKAFNESFIEMFTVKGLDIAQYYPIPELRTMGDIDIVVHENDRTKANEILLELKYTNKSHREDKEWIYNKQGIILELHNCLVYDETVNENKIEAFFNHCWKHVKNGKIDSSFHFLFLLIHLRKHLMNCGVGLRQFMDIALMSQNEAMLNWEWIDEKLEELDIKEFAKTCFGFIHGWFGIVVPYKSNKIDKDFYETATEEILANGVFGFSNSKNKINSAVNMARKHSIHKIGILTNAFKFAFPSYKEMNSRTAYAYLDNNPGLLPIAWVHRYIRGIKKKDKVKEEIKSLFVTEKEIDIRDEYLKNWRL